MRCINRKYRSAATRSWHLYSPVISGLATDRPELGSDSPIAVFLVLEIQHLLPVAEASAVEFSYIRWDGELMSAEEDAGGLH